MRKVVVVKMELEILVQAPEDCNRDNVESFLNDSSHCSENELRALVDNFENGFCRACSYINFTYLREATDSDLENVPSALPKTSRI